MPYRFFLILTLVLASLASLSPVLAQEAVHSPGHEATADAHHGGEEHHVLPLKPPVLFHIGKLTVTNSMMVTWFVAAGIILLAQIATRTVKPVPTGLQNFW